MSGGATYIVNGGKPKDAAVIPIWLRTRPVISASRKIDSIKHLDKFGTTGTGYRQVFY